MDKESIYNGKAADLKSKRAKSNLKLEKSDNAKAQRQKPRQGDVTRIYLSEIGRAKLLTADEEKSLSRAAHGGFMASRQRMI